MRQKNRIKQINNSLNSQQLTNRNIPSSKLLLQKPHFKEEILFSNKSQKHILLSLIKTAQVELLSSLKQNSDNFKKKKKNLFLKNLLLDLKKNLLFVLNEKNKSKSYYENNLKNTKLKFQKNYGIFDKKYRGNELSKLKILNFKIENDILETDFLIEKTQELINFLKITRIFPEENREIFLKNKNEIDKILNVKVKKGKELLKEIANKKKKQNNNIEQIIEEINEIKEENGLIESTDIIFEETSENRIFNNLSYIYNKENNEANETKKESKTTNNNINAQNKSSLANNNINNMYNLNMNIHFNINFHDIINKSFDDNLKENKDNKEKEINHTKYNINKIYNSSGHDLEKELKSIKKIILTDRGTVPNNDILFH